MTDYIKLPKELTAENGAKGLLSGEFFEEVKVRNPEYCANSCDESEPIKCKFCPVDEDLKEEYFYQKIPISWTNIKKIYKMIAEEMTL